MHVLAVILTLLSFLWAIGLAQQSILQSLARWIVAYASMAAAWAVYFTALADTELLSIMTIASCVIVVLHAIHYLVMKANQ